MLSRTVRLISYLLIVLVITNCGWGGKATEDIPLTQGEQNPIQKGQSEEQTSKPTIALVMKTLTNPFFVEMEKGARQAEAELGFNLLVKTGAEETSIEQQIAIIKSLIAEHVDAIVIAPADSTNLIPVLKEAQDAGIVIVNVDNPLNANVAAQMQLTGVPIVTVDNEYGAYLSTKQIADQVHKATKAIILEGIPSAANAEARKNGALRAFGEQPLIEIVAIESAHWKIDEAHDVVLNLYIHHPDIGMIFAANDMMALGALRYLADEHKTDVLVAAYDALDEAKAALLNGTLQATVDQQAARQAYTAIQIAVRVLNGEAVEPVTLVDVKLITKANANQ